MTQSSPRLAARMVAASCRTPRCTGEQAAVTVGLSGRDPAVASTPRVRGPRYRLEFADGRVVDVRGRGLIGRDPRANADIAHLVAVGDRTASLSRTHLEFGVTETGLWVRDWNSTNGSWLEANGRRIRVASKSPMHAPPGSTIHMGAVEVKVRLITDRGHVGAVRFEWGAASRLGTERAQNQDAYLAAPPVFVVADGMGGHSAGGVASAAVVKALSPLTEHDIVTRELAEACLADARARVGRIPCDGGRPAGTTVSGVIVTQIGDTPHWMTVNIGDSRTYRLDRSGFRQVSVDHSLARELADRGAVTASAARAMAFRNVLTRSLMKGADHEIDIALLSLTAGDRILVCSDGLWDCACDEYIAEVLRTTPDPQLAADILVKACADARGLDDATALVIDAVTVGARRPLASQGGTAR